MTVEQLTQITSAPKEAVPGRMSFQDAAKAVLDNSRLKALSEGRGNANEWPQAIAADCAAMTDLYVKLAEDLTRITGVKATHLTSFTPSMFSEACAKPYPDTQARAAGLWDYLRKATENWHRMTVHRIASESAVVNRRKPVGKRETRNATTELFARIVYPLFPVEHKGDTATFLGLGAGVGGEKLYEVKLAGFSYADPDDHPMNMPASVQAKLAVLKSTHFNYHPKVLRGVQVAKKDVTLEESVRYRQYDPDPALVIHFGLEFKPFVAEFWEEPLSRNESTPANQPSLRDAALQGGLLFVTAVLLCCSWLTTGLPWWGNTLLTFFGLSCLFACWATFAVYRDGVQEAFESMRGVERHELRL